MGEVGTGAPAVLVGWGSGQARERNHGCSGRQLSRFHETLETQAWVWCQLFKEARMESWPSLG